MNEKNYPELIKNFLSDELCYVTKILSEGKYHVLLEVGSATSIKAPSIIQANCKYYGIDINANFVQEARPDFVKKNLLDKAKTKLMSFFELDFSFEAFNQDEKVLIILPFNLFGNLGNPKNTLRKLISLSQDFIVSYYTINHASYIARKEYYENCDYNNLSYTQDDFQAKFVSSEGFCSVTYSPEYIEAIICEMAQKSRALFKIVIEHNFFNHIGLATYVRFLNKS